MVCVFAGTSHENVRSLYVLDVTVLSSFSKRKVQVAQGSAGATGRRAKPAPVLSPGRVCLRGGSGLLRSVRLRSGEGLTLAPHPPG